MATLTIPARSTNVSLFLALSDFFGENEDIPPKIDLDFSILRYIEPPCITFLGNFTRWFLNMGVNVSFSGMNLRSEAIKFLDDSLFFEQHLGKKLSPSSSPRSTTLPLKHLSHADSHSWLENEFIPWLSEKSGLSITSLAEVRTCIKEVINNISDHTAYNEGCIFAQWYPQMKLIKVSIADFGCGITETVRRENPDCTDAEAILWAAQEGTSSKSLPSNRGAGLYLLLQNIVGHFNGSVTITSHAGRVRFAKLGDSVYDFSTDVTHGSRVGFCVGTSIDITLNTENIPHADEEEDFEWQF